MPLPSVTAMDELVQWPSISKCALTILTSLFSGLIVIKKEKIFASRSLIFARKTFRRVKKFRESTELNLVRLPTKILLQPLRASSMSQTTTKLFQLMLGKFSISKSELLSRDSKPIS